MGMTIDEAINSIEKRVLPIYDNDADYKALVMAIDTIRKYQKIQEIVKQKDYDRFNSHNYYGYFLRVQDIKKVVEDGTN